MSDTAPLTATPAATPTPLPNVVLPSNFNDLAARQTNLARSPLERRLEDAETRPQDQRPNDDYGPTPPGVMDFESRLAASQQQDARRAQGLVDASSPARDAQPASQQQARQPDDPAAPRSNVEFKRLNGRTQKHVSAIKAQAAERVAALEQELATLRQGGVPPGTTLVPSPASIQQADLSKLSLERLLIEHPDLKRLKEERDTFYEEVKHVRVEADPEFRAKFDSRREAAIRIAKSVAGGAGDDIARIMAIQDSDSRRTQLAERIKDFGDGSKAKIIAAVSALDSLDVEREMEISSRKSTWEHTQAARQQQQSQQFNQRVAKLDQEFDSVVAKWADPEKGMPFVMKNPQETVTLARRIFSGEADASALAEAAMKAAVLGDVLTLTQSAFTEIESLREQLARFTGVYPGDDNAGVTPVPQNGAATPADMFNASYVSNFDQKLQQARQADAARLGR